ncbi:hypothetical protein N836_06560 [Leptolyngbya sp. Heron Island J]|uniref:hypothetical protein n=1 Tax=Leptolyngbya sp. Heron Island J TaxID=1385935 RepID=UPI0003B94AC2|nr:hypothetical protein [Leptolyngbya sp. Heron Island J]ESA36718.1 hypothetical protein N836_06560 [Leptolyngbya sp. Heron Island J]
MAPNGFKQLQLNFSGMGCWLTLAIGFLLMTTVGIGWLLKSLLVLIVLLLLIPVVLVVGVQFWLRRNLVEGSCPACDQPLTGFKTIPLSCPSCGAALQAMDGTFVRVAAEGTIDVDAINVDVSNLDDGPADNVTIVDVDVLPPADT